MKKRTVSTLDSRYLMNSSDDVTIRNRATVMMCPVMPAVDTKHTVIGSCKGGGGGERERERESRIPSLSISTCADHSLWGHQH